MPHLRERHREGRGAAVVIAIEIYWIYTDQNMVGEGRAMVITLTAPISLEKGLAAEHQPPNLFHRVISLFLNVRPGSDLTNFQLPAVFNIPKSQLQLYGESVYCINEDLLTRCAQGKSSLERFINVVAWNLSTIRPVIVGLAPFNPVLGETHHVTRGNLNVFLEQVSHNPPVSALHATDQEEKLEVIWYQCPSPKFHGKSIKVTIKGKKHLRLFSHGESYEMNSPDILFSIFPVPGADWAGKVSILCKESGLEAELILCKSQHFFGFGGKSRLIKGKIFHSESLQTIYEVDGQWDRTVTLKDINTGHTSVLYDARQSVLNLKTPILTDSEGVRPTESTVVWGEVGRAIMQGNWEKAREEKREVEERERRLRSDRKCRGEDWVPKHFKASQNKEGQWECWPLESFVSPAPIVAPP